MAEDYQAPAEPGKKGFTRREPGEERLRDLTTPFHKRELEALRAELAIQAAKRCRLPAAWRDVLVAEAAGLLDASRRYAGSLSATGWVSTRGNEVRAAYREYLELQSRLERVMMLLSLNDKRRADRPGPPPAAGVDEDPLAGLDEDEVEERSGGQNAAGDS